MLAVAVLLAALALATPVPFPLPFPALASASASASASSADMDLGHTHPLPHPHLQGLQGHALELELVAKDWHWECRNGSQDGRPGEVACRCYGMSLTTVPNGLHRNMHSLTIEHAGLHELRRDSLDPYKHTLADLALRELRHLSTIEPGAFSALTKLRSIYIAKVPRLISIPSGVFNQLSPSFRVLRIHHTALEEIPDMTGLGTHEIIQQIDLESNRIRQIESNAVRVRAERLMLDYNSISSVKAWAFNGSQIAKLTLRGNRKLEHLSLSAFAGLSSLRDLDLSETAITRLPTVGLEELDVLRIQDTNSLTTIPSVYSFKHLQEAWLTYSFHCCAFAFPATHDPKRHQSHQKYLASIAAICRDPKAVGVNPEVLAELAESELWGAAVEGESADRSRPRSPRSPRSAGPGRRIVRTASRPEPDSLWGDAVYDQDDGKDYPDEPDEEGSEGEGSWTNIFDEAATQSPTAPAPHYYDPVWLAQDEAGVFGDVIDDGYRSDQADPSDRVIPTEPVPRKAPGDHGDLQHDYHGDLQHEHDGYFHSVATLPAGKLHAICGNLSMQRPAVRCWPAPDALNPCEDIMGYSWLRGLVWLVVLATVAGNLAVLAVLLTNVPALTVPRFLMCHLALADLCMGLYLLLLAAMDLQSRGEYFNYACAWQVERGCAVAGFLTIFSSQLSIYTLCVITLERWFAITYAIDLNKRLRLGAAAHVMVAGWLYAITMAALPLAGVSSYSSTSICLPMETRDVAGLVYLIVLLLVAALAFVVVLVCYLQIYLSLGPDTRHHRRPCRPSAPLRQSSSTRRPGEGPGGGGGLGGGRARMLVSARAELSVANKMALLVLTDFTCWAPIAFFSLTALAGHPLISVTNSKILLVFFYPLNACANPFLYAILTAQYRRDLCILLSRCGLCTKLAHKYKLAGYSSPTTNNSNQPLALPLPLPLSPRDAACYDGPETMSSLLVSPPSSRTGRASASTALNSLNSQHSRDEAFV